MKRVACGLALATMLAAPSLDVEARTLEEILREKGVLTDEEASEATMSAPKGVPLDLHWDKGLRATSPDGKFKFKLGGRIQNDWAYFDEDSDTRDAFSSTDDEGNVTRPDFGSGTEFRRARIYVEGEYSRYTFKAQYDFAGGDADFKDVYVGVKKIPFLGTFKIGQFKEPFSLEELTSSKYITFMERALPNAFTPSRNTGFGFSNAVMEERATYAAGFFRGDTDDFGVGFGEADIYDFSARLTGLPIYADEGRQLVHVGFSYNHLFNDDADVRFRQRPEAHLSPLRFVDTGSFAADGLDRIAAEAAAVFGPFSVQGEYLPVFVDSDEGGDPDLTGWYVFASVFLTGENRAYKTSAGTFDRVKPKANFLDGKGGLGAWELGVRYSGMDLNDAEVEGGELSDLTIGANWYWDANFRVMLNYVLADIDDVGETNIIQARFQVDF